MGRALVWVMGLLVSGGTVVAAIESDMPGSQDHPDISRVAGTLIVGYARNDYDVGTFVTGMENRELQTATAEGERTRIVYLGPPGLSPLAILRNYQKAFESLGTVREVFACRDNDCYSNFADAWIWDSSQQVPSVFPDPDYLYRYGSPLYRNQSYWYGTAESAESQYHLSVFSSIRTEGGFKEHLPLIGEGQTLTHLEVVKVADFEPTLETVTAADIAAELDSRGRIAIYGIHFDTDSDALRDDSNLAIREIASALTADPKLNLYVVGHTDDQGDYTYNRALSERRALAVVRALVDGHEVAGDRLTAVGVGPVAPVALNASEAGRALNRRVELVRR